MDLTAPPTGRGMGGYTPTVSQDYNPDRPHSPGNINPYDDIPKSSPLSAVKGAQANRELWDFIVSADQLGVELDTNEELARLNSSIWLGARMGVSAQDVFQNFDAYSQAYYGAATPPKTAWQAINDEFKTARLSIKGMRLGADMMMSKPDSPGFDFLFDEYIKTLERMPIYDEVDRPLWVKALKAAASFAPSVGASMLAGAAGAIASTAAGLTPIPGFKIGASAENFRIASGGIFADIIMADVPQDDGSTLPLWRHLEQTIPEEELPEVKRKLVAMGRAAATAGGIISAGIELAQLDILVGGKLLGKSVEHASGALLKTIMNTKRMANGAVRLIVAHGGNVAENTIQEYLQENVEWISSELVKRVTEDAHKVGIPTTSLEEWTAMMRDVAETAALGSFVLGIPGSIMQTARSGRSANQVQDIPEGEGLPIDIILPPERAATGPERQNAESQLAAEKEGQGRLAPIDVYKDEEGYHAINPGVYETAIENGLDKVRINIVEKPTVTETVNEQSYAEPQEMTRDEYVRTEVNTQAEAENKQTQLDRDLFRQQVVENLPNVTEQDIDKGLALVDIFAKYRGMTTDKFLQEAFSPEAILYKEAIPGAKAAVEFDGSKAHMVFTATSDFSSLVHEFSHVARQWLKPGEVKDLEMFYRARFGREGTFGVSEIEIEERFAKDFEEYLRSGKAPDQRIANLFAQIAALLREVLDKVRGLPSVPAEVQAVLDRVFSGEEAPGVSTEQQLFQEKNEISQIEADRAALVEDITADGTKFNFYVNPERGTATLARIQIPDDLQGLGKATIAMVKTVEFADKYGLRVDLTPSDSFGSNKNRLVKFYKRFGFIENKGKNKDYEIGNTMYRVSNSEDTGNVLYQTEWEYPVAHAVVSGFEVLDNIPNQASISASFGNYEILDGIRELPMSDFGGPRSVFYASDDFRKSEELAKQIEASKEISPLIIAVDSEGPYILEGAHRFVALHNLNVETFPAQVVIDKDDEVTTLFQSAPPVESEAFKTWFGESKVVNESGEPKRVYHGSKRPDRIGDVFLPGRATSGPMSFFTDDPDIASSYAQGKEDTSLERTSRDDIGNFTIAVNGEEIGLEKAWDKLPAAKRGRVRMDYFNAAYDYEHFWIEGKSSKGDIEDNVLPGRDHLEYVLKDNKRNVLVALHDLFMLSGMMFQDGEGFANVLREFGLDTRFDDPWAEFPAVYPVFLSIQNPLTTMGLDPLLMEELRAVAEKQPAPEYANGIDQWDKDSRDPIVWIEALEQDQEDGTTLAWTSIPDWVSSHLKSRGFDGIIDAGGKQGGTSHGVYIPFESTQVKSAIGNKGDYSPTNPSILYQKAEEAHETAVQQAVEDGRPVSDNVLEDYRGREWADKELERRRALREEFSWVMELAKESESWEALKAQIEEDPEIAELSGNIKGNDEWYQKAWHMAHVPSRKKGNKAFLASISEDEEFRQILRDMHSSVDQMKGLGMHPRVFAAVKRGFPKTNSEIAGLRTIVSRHPETYRKALAIATENNEALSTLQYEHDTAIIEIDSIKEEGKTRDRMTLAAKIDDPTLRKRALAGDMNTKELDNLATAYRGELSKLETENATNAQKTAKKAEIIAVRKMRDYKKLLGKRIISKRGTGGTIDLATRKVIENIQAQVDPNFRSDKTLTLRKEDRDAITENPALQGIIDPKGKAFTKSLNELTVAELEELADQIKALKEVGRKIQGAKDAAKKARRDIAAASGTREALAGEEASEFSATGSQEFETERKTGVVGQVKAASMRPSRVIRMLFGEDSTMYDWFIRKVRKARDAMLKFVTSRHEKGKAKMAELGITAKRLADELVVDGMTFSRDQVIGIHIFMQNRRSRAAVLYGNGITFPQVIKLTGKLSNQDKAWGEWMMKDFDGNYDRFRNAYVENTNEEMGKEVNYFPMSRLGKNFENLDAEVADQMLTRNAWKVGYVDKKSTISRIEISDEHQTAIRLDSTAIWHQQIEKQEHYIASGTLVMDLHAIRSKDNITNAIRQKFGDRYNKWLEKYVNDFASPNIYKSYDATSQMFSKLRRNYALAALSWNLLTIAKQAPSLTLFLSRVGPIKLMAAAGQVMANRGKWEAFVNEKDPHMKDRAMERYMEELKNQGQGAKGIPKKIAELGMKPIQWVDKTVTTMGWLAVYNDRLAQGFSEEQAIVDAQAAVLETQPAARAEEIAEMYRSGEGLNWFLMFTNQINQIWNLTAFDLPHALKVGQIREAAGIVAGVMVGFASMALLSGWRPPEEDVPKEITREFVKQWVNTLPLVGGVVSSGMSKWGASGVQPFPLAAQIGEMSEFIFADNKTQKKFIKRLEGLGKGAGMLMGVPTVETFRIIKAFETGADAGVGKAFLELFGPAFKEELGR